MKITLPTTIPATIELPEGFLLKFKQSPVRHDATEASLLEGADEIWFECGCGISEALLALLACLDEDTRLPAATVLVLRDLAHEAVDVVCPRLSSEPLERAVFVDAPLLPAPETGTGAGVPRLPLSAYESRAKEGSTARSKEHVRR